MTVCNLNSFRSEKLEERNLTDLLQLIALLILQKRDEHCEDVLESVPQSNSLNIAYEELIVQARHRVEDFILGCAFCWQNVW